MIQISQIIKKINLIFYNSPRCCITFNPNLKDNNSSIDNILLEKIRELDINSNIDIINIIYNHQKPNIINYVPDFDIVSKIPFHNVLSQYNYKHICDMNYSIYLVSDDTIKYQKIYNEIPEIGDENFINSFFTFLSLYIVSLYNLIFYKNVSNYNTTPYYIKVLNNDKLTDDNFSILPDSL